MKNTNPSRCLDPSPVRDPFAAELLDLTANRLRARRVLGLLPSAEAMSLFSHFEVALDDHDLQLLDQVKDILSIAQPTSEIATGVNRAGYDIATITASDIATTDTESEPREGPAIQGFAGSEEIPCAVAPTYSPLTPASSIPPTSVDRPEEHRSQSKDQARWDRLTAQERFLATVEAAARAGGRAVTLALSANREARLRASSDPTRLLSHYINRRLKAAGMMVSYSFRFEISDEGRLHVHGAVTAGSNSAAELKRLKQVLVDAAGKIRGRAGSKQCVYKDIYFSAGWHGYIQKTQRKTAKALGTEKTTFVSQGMTELAREEYERGDVTIGNSRAG